MQYALGVQVYGEVLYLKFYSFSQNRILTMKYCSVKDCNSTFSCKNVILHTIKEQWIANGKQIFLDGYAVGILKINAIEVSIVKSYGTML